MKRRPVQVDVSDHAVLRWLEREHGLDLAGVKAMIVEQVTNGASLGAVAVCLGRVRFVLREHHNRRINGVRVVVTTTLARDMPYEPERPKREGREG